jgi:tRNA pseudouridine(55) synthase
MSSVYHWGMRPPRYVVLRKDVGSTPLETINAWKKEHPEFADVPASYAGRLDPMASGKLLVLLGTECKKQSHYIGLDKEYEVEVLLGIGSDTGDILGLAAHAEGSVTDDAKRIANAVYAEMGAHERAYPVYSSKTVNGKPLFLYALEGTLDTITIPAHTEHIYKIQMLGTDRIDARALRARINALLAHTPKSDEPSKVLGADFRIEAVQKSWDTLFDSLPPHNFTILKLRVVSGSGTYMRTLAARIGATLGTTALALSINRCSLGRYVPLGPFSFWLKRY